MQANPIELHPFQISKKQPNFAKMEPNANKSPWSASEVIALINLPFNDLLFKAQQIHREIFNPNEVQLSTLLSIKTGGCPEDCAYCPQSVHYETGIEASKIMQAEDVRNAAQEAKRNGASRFCMGAAWREPKDRDIEKVTELVKVIKAEGLEACCTLGMLSIEHAKRLKQAGLDFYNHNLDTAPENYADIISTRIYEERLNTLARVREAGINVCSGGIVGMGESREERAKLLFQLANLDPYPESVPINNLVQVEGTPLFGTIKLDPLEFVRTIAVARIVMPRARVRLSAGRQEMSESTQALCFLAGANSIFYGDKLLTTGNPDWARDQELFEKLGIKTS
jgi:biotin synthase